jgi:hypothetical protein
MVTHPRTSSRTHQLRSLNQPQEIQVHTTPRGFPREIQTSRGRQNVQEIQDIWRIDDEWWREPVVRRYFRLLLGNGHLCTVYQDMTHAQWYMQGY